MRVLVACEESQEVCKAFRMLGHEAYSRDVQEPSGGHPEWHLQADVLELLKMRWDMLLAFPPCTHLCSSGQHWFTRGLKDPELREQGARFFMRFVAADCPRIAIENPVGIMSTRYRKPDQIIHPWQFGHEETKTTCLWLKGLPPLKPTNVVDGREQRVWKMPPVPERSKLRSKTYPGIAKAMAEQWGGNEMEVIIDGKTAKA